MSTRSSAPTKPAPRRTHQKRRPYKKHADGHHHPTKDKKDKDHDTK